MNVALADLARRRAEHDARARLRAQAAPASARPGHNAARRAKHDRPPLRLVATRPLTVSRLPFAVLVGTILAAGLVGLLLLHTMAAQDAFRLESLQQKSAELSDAEQQLMVAEQQREAPSALARRARALGMVPTGSIAFVKLHHHGKIVGVVNAVPPPPPPAPRPSPSASKAVESTQKSAAAGKHAKHHQSRP